MNYGYPGGFQPQQQAYAQQPQAYAQPQQAYAQPQGQYNYPQQQAQQQVKKYNVLAIRIPCHAETSLAMLLLQTDRDMQISNISSLISVCMLHMARIRLPWMYSIRAPTSKRLTHILPAAGAGIPWNADAVPEPAVLSAGSGIFQKNRLYVSFPAPRHFHLHTFLFTLSNMNMSGHLRASNFSGFR
jgi:hypothetical protein